MMPFKRPQAYTRPSASVPKEDSAAGGMGVRSSLVAVPPAGFFLRIQDFLLPLSEVK
jgi:hypothetical protein